MLLSTPATMWLLRIDAWSPEVAALVDKAVPFVFGAVLIAAFPGLRRRAADLLRAPIDTAGWRETAWVAIFHAINSFAWAGIVVLWWWISGGEANVAGNIRALPSDAGELERAFTPADLVRSLVVVAVLAPVVEELVFRGFLYRAWEGRLGWFGSMIATSIVFAAYHANPFPAFLSSVIYVCLYRRTGSLWAPIVVHMIFNALAWYPLLGQLVFPRSLDAPGDLSSWAFHIACLLLAIVVLPAYVWMAREPAMAEDFPPLEADVALSK
ncbi:MAG TPA: CPBP family intramembrane glutamic endopeptidase [Usitatibacter sp.]|nr:CPBP family intramembrane glutamic endopeptidase [Usitatibacter sp.]